MQPVPVGRRNGGKGGGQSGELLRSTVKIGRARVFSKGFVSFRLVRVLGRIHVFLSSWFFQLVNSTSFPRVIRDISPGELYFNER